MEIYYHNFYKKHKFSFDIVKMPFRKSDLPHKIFWNTITAEILSISTINSQKHNFRFQSSNNKHIFRTLKQGANLKALTRVFNEVIYQHQFGKFNASKESLKQDITQASKTNY